MKFNIEVEVDWLDEDQSLDNELKEQIKDGIINRISEKSIEDLKVQASKMAVEKVEKWLDDFLAAEIGTVKFPYGKYDGWSNQQPEMLTIPEIISKEFEKALRQPVNSKGEYTESSYSKFGTRLEWLTGKLAEKIADEKIKSFVSGFYRDIETFLSEKLKSALTEQISSAIANQIDLTKILK